LGLRYPESGPPAGSDATEPERRALAELIRRTYRYAHMDAALAAADAILAARWRRPAPTLTPESDLAACRPGTVVTDRDGHRWVRNAAGQWCEPPLTGCTRTRWSRMYPDEVEWAPLTRHLGGDR
jgi:hypothetical protein